MGSTTSTRLRAAGGLLLVLTGCASAPAQRGFVPPLDRMVVSAEFGERRGLGRRAHKGTDIRAPHGAPVAAVRGGRVAFAGERRGFGRLLIVDHGEGLKSYYAHLSGFAARRGEAVGTGQTIGFVGRSGNATGPHLHLEMRQDGQPRDARGWIAF